MIVFSSLVFEISDSNSSKILSSNRIRDSISLTEMTLGSLRTADTVGITSITSSLPFAFLFASSTNLQRPLIAVWFPPHTLHLVTFVLRDIEKRNDNRLWFVLVRLCGSRWFVLNGWFGMVCVSVHMWFVSGSDGSCLVRKHSEQKWGARFLRVRLSEGCG